MTAYLSEYSLVTDMFRRLKSLDEGSAAFRRQREVIFEQSLPIADHIARRFSNRGEPLDDLMQVARVGLVNAVNRFDVDNGADFLKDLQKELVRARGELSQRLHRAPSVFEIADHLGIDRELVVEAMIAGENYSTLSTDVQVGRGDGRDHHDDTDP